MVNHSTENSKSNQKQNQISNEGQQPVQMSSESGNVSRTRSGLYGVRSELNRMNSNSEGVLAELNRMNAKMKKMIGCFNRMLHDRGKELGHGFNGGFHEFQNVGRREHRGEIENQNFLSKFDSQFRCSSMESETSRHPFMANLIRNGDSKASRQRTDNNSEILEANVQAMWNLTNRSPIGDEGMRKSIPFVTDFHGAIGKTEVQFSNFEDHANTNAISIVTANVDQLNLGGIDQIVSGFHEVNGLGNSHVHDVLGEEMMEVETNEVLVETEEILVESAEVLVDEELGNARYGIDFGAKTITFGIENAAANAIIGTEMSENGAAKNGLLQIIFNDPFYDAIKSALVNDKIHLLLAVEIAISMVEEKGWLALECEVCRLVLRSQDMCAAAEIGAQWLRRGVG